MKTLYRVDLLIAGLFVIVASVTTTPVMAQGWPFDAWSYGTDDFGADKLSRLEHIYTDKAEAAIKSCNRSDLQEAIRKLGNLQRLAADQLVVAERHLEADQGLVDDFKDKRDMSDFERMIPWDKDEIDFFKRKVADLARLAVILNSSFDPKRCPPPTTPPPPPPPPPPPTTNPPVKIPPPVSPTHRTTNCVPCQGLADKLNEAADKYAEARNRHDPDQSVFLREVHDAAAALDACEKKCLVLQQHETPPVPSVAPPPASAPTHRQTGCDRCQKAADRLKKASDQLAQDLADPTAAPETLADDRSLVKDYSKLLDDCEKHCKDSGGLLDHVTIGVGVDVGGGHDHGDGHQDHHSDHSDVP